MNSELLINLVYIFSAILFIVGIKMLSSLKTARRGNLVSALGMLVAIVVTLLDKNIVNYQWIIIGMLLGSLIGVFSAKKIDMTSMPEMVAIFNALGGGASMLVALSELFTDPVANTGIKTAGSLTVLIGGVTLTGSLIAFLKLGEIISGRPFLYRGQNIINSIVCIGLITVGVLFVFGSGNNLLLVLLGLSLLFGILIVLPIGGADMPVVISLLNSYSGIAASTAGFILLNNVMIVTGALVGASGIILTNIMCKSMNRSLKNVLFSGFGSVKKTFSAEKITGEIKPITPDDAYLILESAGNVVFVPGYGMAVSQAQHAVRELAELMEANGTQVRYAIHPVAGRMPGHMNVMLAEANISYDLLVEPEMINPTMNTVDVCIIIGANDVVNPSAKEVQSSPIYGMPIIEAYNARTVFVLKRSMASGFSGVDNPLFFLTNTRMIFGDAKSSLNTLISEFKS